MAEGGAEIMGEGRRGTAMTTTMMTNKTKKTKKRDNTDPFDDPCIKLQGGVRT